MKQNKIFTLTIRYMGKISVYSNQGSSIFGNNNTLKVNKSIKDVIRSQLKVKCAFTLNGHACMHACPRFPSASLMAPVCCPWFWIFVLPYLQPNQK